jgi:hypothetical protein
MQVLSFKLTAGQRTLEVPTGKLVIRRVPSIGLMGMHYPKTGRAQVLVSPGKVKGVTAVEDALIHAWKIQVHPDASQYTQVLG